MMKIWNLCLLQIFMVEGNVFQLPKQCLGGCVYLCSKTSRFVYPFIFKNICNMNITFPSSSEKLFSFYFEESFSGLTVIEWVKVKTL